MTALALATFEGEGPYLRARTRAIADGHRIAGAWLPYAADHLGEGEGTRGIRPAATVAGVTGALALLALTAWSAILAYPFDEGGRPSWSWPAFLPAPIEFGALIAAIGGAVLMARNAGLTRLHHPAFDWDEVGEAAQGRFVLALACDRGEDANAAVAMLAAAGALRTRLVGA